MRFVFPGIVVAAMLAACGGGGDSGESDATRQAKALYGQRCALCHGLDGRGDGMMASKLTTEPRDYSSAEWQASVTDETLRQTILQGGRALGLDVMMPATPELAETPEVLDALIAHIRGFQR